LADPQGGYLSGCRLIDGGSGPKSVGGSPDGTQNSTRKAMDTRRLVQASSE
jgi:hypothetical protein